MVCEAGRRPFHTGNPGSKLDLSTTGVALYFDMATAIFMMLRQDDRSKREVTMRRLALVVVFCLAAAVPSYAQDKAAIQKLVDQFAEAYNKGDAAAVSQMYTDDAVLLPPGAEMVRGKDAIQGFWKQQVERSGDLKVTVVETKSLGSDVAHAIGTTTSRTKGQQPQTLSGKGTVLLQRVGTDWKIATHIWNRNK